MQSGTFYVQARVMRPLCSCAEQVMELTSTDIALMRIWSHLMLQQVPQTSTQVDLEVFLQAVGEELHGELIYNADLFEESTAQRIAGHFQVCMAWAKGALVHLL